MRAKELHNRKYEVKNRRKSVDKNDTKEKGKKSTCICNLIDFVNICQIKTIKGQCHVSGNTRSKLEDN